jgi:hypothetical protein
LAHTIDQLTLARGGRVTFGADTSGDSECVQSGWRASFWRSPRAAVTETSRVSTLFGAV